MKRTGSKLLDKYVLCESCKETFVKRVFSKYANKPLCSNCRSEQAAKKAREEFNAAGMEYVQIETGCVA